MSPGQSAVLTVIGMVFLYIALAYAVGWLKAWVAGVANREARRVNLDLQIRVDDLETKVRDLEDQIAASD